MQNSLSHGIFLTHYAKIEWVEAKHDERNWDIGLLSHMHLCFPIDLNKTSLVIDPFCKQNCILFRWTELPLLFLLILHDYIF